LAGSDSATVTGDVIFAPVLQIPKDRVTARVFPVVTAFALLEQIRVIPWLGVEMIFWMGVGVGTVGSTGVTVF
jgi:hypothetical protein